MIFDTHCHSSEGSKTDARVSIFNTVDILKDLGFNGMVITDHNSYNGYKAWEKSGRNDFTVIRGIEYDTKDAGHIIIVVPKSTESEIFTVRGLKVNTVLDIVKALNGIAGPAHPYDYRRLGIANNPKWLNKIDIFNRFDFIEGFNSCGTHLGAKLAQSSAKAFKKPYTAGSDSHRINCIGLARTEIDAEIKNEEDYIKAIKDRKIISAEGNFYNKALHNSHNKIFGLGLMGYYGLNKCISLALLRKRERLLQEVFLQLGYVGL